MDKTRHSRRNFLIAVGASGAAAAAAIGAKAAPAPANAAKKDGTKRTGYELTEHVRRYYRTTLV